MVWRFLERAQVCKCGESKRDEAPKVPLVVKRKERSKDEEEMISPYKPQVMLRLKKS